MQQGSNPGSQPLLNQPVGEDSEVTVSELKKKVLVETDSNIVGYGNSQKLVAFVKTWVC